jgi:hypothetical protein
MHAASFNLSHGRPNGVFDRDSIADDRRSCGARIRSSSEAGTTLTATSEIDAMTDLQRFGLALIGAAVGVAVGGVLLGLIGSASGPQHRAFITVLSLLLPRACTPAAKNPRVQTEGSTGRCYRALRKSTIAAFTSFGRSCCVQCPQPDKMIVPRSFGTSVLRLAMTFSGPPPTATTRSRSPAT